MKLILFILTISLVGQVISELDISKSNAELITLTEGLEYDVHREIDSIYVEVKQIYANQQLNGNQTKETYERRLNGFLFNTLGYLTTLQDGRHVQCFEGKFENIGSIKNQAVQIFGDCLTNARASLEDLKTENTLQVAHILDRTSKFEQISQRCLELKEIEELKCRFEGAEEIRKLATNLKRVLIATTIADSDITGKLNACNGNAVKRVERDVTALVDDVKSCIDHKPIP